MGLRVAAVAVASALVVIGLEAPASAASPTISSFSPTSGPAGCVVVIRGTNFDNPIVTSVDIGGTLVSAFDVVSRTQIDATVAGGASGTIHVTNATDTATSATAFTNANPGGCSPTISFFMPCGGEAGTQVTIVGTNLLKSSGTLTSAPVGGDVRFAPYTASAMDTGAGVTPTQLFVVVPVDAADGPIRVSTFNDIVGEGAALSDAPFQTPPPDYICRVARSMTLSLRKNLVARGKVSVGADHFSHCAAGVPVKVQRRFPEGWKMVGSTTTNVNGAYTMRIPDRPSRYRARAPEVLRGTGGVGNICLRAISPVRIRS